MGEQDNADGTLMMEALRLIVMMIRERERIAVLGLVTKICALYLHLYLSLCFKMYSEWVAVVFGLQPQRLESRELLGKCQSLSMPKVGSQDRL